MPMSDDDDRAADLEFIDKIRSGTYAEVRQLAVNVSFGAPRWQCVAVKRALEKRTQCRGCSVSGVLNAMAEPGNAISVCMKHGGEAGRRGVQ
jgi:hypothetical protein